MALERSPLTDQQLALLRWIGDGCPDGVWPDHSHKAFMRVLETRALASTRRWYGKWGAVLLPAGRYYLDHGTYPDEQPATPSAKAAASASSVSEPVATADAQPVERVSPVPRRRKANAARVNLSQQLVNDIVAADGTLRLAQDIYDHKARQSLLSRIRFAYEKGYVPAGKQITERRIDREFVEVSIVDLPAWRTEVLPPIAVPGRLADLHPAVEVVREMDAILPIKPVVLRNRALRLLQAIAQASVERGWQVASPGRPDRWGRRHDDIQGHLRITVHEHAMDLSIVPMDEQVEHKPTAQEREYNEKYGTRIRKWDIVPSRNRLKLELPGRFVHRTTTWSDKDGRPLESCLPEVLQELGLRAVEAERDRIRQEELRRAAEAEQAARVARATARFVEAHRVKVLTEQVTAWRQARELERYLAAMRAHIETLTDLDEQQAAEEWLAWAEAYVPKLDPLSKTLRMPPDPKPRYGELDPFLERPRPLRHF